MSKPKTAQQLATAADHPEARSEAKILVGKHDGQAGRIVEDQLDTKLAHGDMEAALHLDRVRREIEKVEGEG